MIADALCKSRQRFRRHPPSAPNFPTMVADEEISKESAFSFLTASSERHRKIGARGPRCRVCAPPMARPDASVYE